MKKFELRLELEMLTEMEDIPSIKVYQDNELIATHEMIYAEDLYGAIIGKIDFYEEINRARKEGEKRMKLLVKLLYAIDNGLLILYYNTKFKPFETIGAHVGGLGNKLNKEIK